MNDEHFVGRNENIAALHALLGGHLSKGGNLVVQSIEGPGGIGKTSLYEHAIAAIDLTERRYLTLRVSGNCDTTKGLASAVSQLIDSGKSIAPLGRSSRSCFPEVERVEKIIATVRSEAIEEFKRKHPDNDRVESSFIRFIDAALAAGKKVNDLVPATKDKVNVHQIDECWSTLKDTIPHMTTLMQEAPGLLDRFGQGSTAARNAVRENACKELGKAIVTDLTAILSGYPWNEFWKPRLSKIEGVDRLLLVIDDYEAIQNSFGEFLVGYLLPELRVAKFETVVVILGRDQLEATSPSWDQHLRANLLKPIVVKPLTRLELNQLLESHDVVDAKETDRAWNDTEGYPYCLQLWIEEIASGGRTAVMLKQFHDRTTRWMSDQQRHWLNHVLFLEEVNVRTLRSILEKKEEATEAFKWFEREPSVRDTTGGFFRVRAFHRSRLLDYLRVSDPDLHDQLLARVSSAGAV